MASQKQLNVSVRMNTSQAEKSLKRLQKQITNIDKALNKTRATNLEKQLSRAGTQATKLRTKIGKVNSALSKTSSSANKVSTNLRKAHTQLGSIRSKTQQWWSAQKQVTSATRSTNTVLGSVFGKLKAIASAYLGIMGMRAMINTSDTITASQNKLNYVASQQLGDDGFADNGGYSEATLKHSQLAMDKMYASAQKVRMGYTDMLKNVSKSMTLAGDAFQNNTDNAIRFQEIMSEAYTIGGASAEEMSSSMYQMIQALGAGTLAGDELRSVREGAPLAYQAIEEFAQGVLDSEESLKDLASQGMISSDMVVAAIMNAGDKMDKVFENTYMTFDQAWTKIKNAATKAFEPVSKMMRDMLNNAAESGLFEKIEKGFINVSKALQIIFKVIEMGINWIANNWSWLSDILIAGLITIGIMLVATAVKAFASWVMANLPLIGIFLAIFAIIYALTLWQQGVIDTTELIIICALIIAAALLVIGIIIGSLPMIIMAAIIAILAIVFMFFEEVCGGAMVAWEFLVNLGKGFVNVVAWIVNLIIGILYWCGATLLNIGVGAINAIMEVIYAVIDPIIGVIEWILNACNGGFNSFGDAVANLIGNIIGWFLSLGKVVTTIIDAIFGTNWTAGLDSLKDKVTSWGKNDEAITLDRSAPVMERIDATDAFNKGNSTFEYYDNVFADGWASNAYDKGFNWGSGIKNSINKWGSQFVPEDGSNFLDDIGKKLGLDFSDMTGMPQATDPKYDVSSAYTPDLEGLLNGIGKDTSDIKDSMDLADDDLDFLRRIADMEWRNEFTTAEIKVEMNNNNNVNGERDLDGIVEYLSDKLRSEMTNVAYGVHY